jgi:hypothetical protein
MALRSTQCPTEMSTRKTAWGGKGGRCAGLTTLPPSCADCLEIWKPQPPGALRASPGLYRDRFTLLPLLAGCLSFSSWSSPTPILFVSTTHRWPGDLIHCPTWQSRSFLKLNITGHMVYVVWRLLTCLLTRNHSKQNTCCQLKADLLIMSNTTPTRVPHVCKLKRCDAARTCHYLSRCQ